MPSFAASRRNSVTVIAPAPVPAGHGLLVVDFYNGNRPVTGCGTVAAAPGGRLDPFSPNSGGSTVSVLTCGRYTTSR